MGKWEYMIATLEENEELKILNKLGNEGWQLVAVTCTTDLGIWDGNGETADNKPIAYFKRKKT